MIPNVVYSIKDAILDSVNASKVYLFGSYARGTQTAQSDYDFFVVIPNNSMRPMEAMQKIYATLAAFPMPIPVDILASYEKDFTERKQMPSSLEHTIQKEGILLYEC